jgi:phosphate transport system substrate-binding protein
MKEQRSNIKYQISNIKSQIANPKSRIAKYLSFGICHLIFAICYLIFLPSCGATVTPPAPVYLKAAGSTAMTPLLQDLAAAYHERQPDVTIDINTGGSALGRELASAGQVDFGLTSWLPAGPPQGVQATVVARDGIALIVHPTNVITGLTLAQVHDLFQGSLGDWQAVGGAPAPVQVVSREDGSGTRAAFEALVMQGGRVTPTALVMPNSQAVVDYVARDPRAVGYVSMGYVSDRVRVLAVEGLVPGPQNVSRAEYNLTRDLVILTRPNAPGAVRAFLDFILSPAGQAIVGQRYGRVR